MKSVVTLMICGSMALPATLFAQGAANRSTVRTGKTSSTRTSTSTSRSGLRTTTPRQAERTLKAAGSTSITGIPLDTYSVDTSNTTADNFGTTTDTLGADGHVNAGHMNDVQGLSAPSEDIYAGYELPPAEAAQFIANMADSGAIANLNKAHADLLASVNEYDPKAEDDLGKFVATIVPSWTCGETCVNSVTNVLYEGAEYARQQVEALQTVSIVGAFGYGLESEGISPEVVGENCPELRAVIPMGS